MRRPPRNGLRQLKAVDLTGNLTRRWWKWPRNPLQLGLSLGGFFRLITVVPSDSPQLQGIAAELGKNCNNTAVCRLRPIIALWLQTCECPHRCWQRVFKHGNILNTTAGLPQSTATLQNRWRLIGLTCCADSSCRAHQQCCSQRLLVSTWHCCAELMAATCSARDRVIMRSAMVGLRSHMEPPCMHCLVRHQPVAEKSSGLPSSIKPG